MIHIACAADAGFVPHCAVMLRSLLTSQTPGSVMVHFLHDADLPIDVLSRLGDMVRVNSGLWSPLLVEDSWRSFCPGNWRFGQVAWYRVLLPELLPDLERILYLDADTIVCRALDALWGIDLEGHSVGAVVNPLYSFMDVGFLEDLAVTPEGYFNSGMLLLDLERWRRENLCKRVLQRAVAQGRQEWPDQNALNAVLRGNWKTLSPEWNVQNSIFDLHLGRLPFAAEDVRRARHDPAVVHFIGPYKPWHYRCKHPLRDLYWQHLKHTPWRDRTVDGLTTSNRLLRLLPEQWGWRLEGWYRVMRRRLSRRGGSRG